MDEKKDLKKQSEKVVLSDDILDQVVGGSVSDVVDSIMVGGNNNADIPRR